MDPETKERNEQPVKKEQKCKGEKTGQYANSWSMFEHEEKIHEE